MKKLVLGIIWYALVGISSAQADSWRILFYVDSMEDLNDMAAKAVTEVMCARPADSIEFYIQLHTYRDKGLRYRLDNQKLAVDSEIMLTGDAKQDLLNAARWGFSGHKADHTMLIFNNHGGGVLDPVYNQDLAASLQQIKDEMLHGRDLDILAFDTCMGAMLEVAYQVAPYARYLVGSQSGSLMDGFDYKSIIAVLNQDQNSPEAVSAGMVRAFDAYYSVHDASGIYTHAALDLSQVESVVQALNSLMVLVMALPDRTELLQDARDQAPRFCMWPMYTDPIAFCDLVEQQLRACDSADISRILYSAIYQAISNIRSAVDRMVVARCAGMIAGADAHGCAIYCPAAHIDNSYTKTEFAKSCKWYQALQVMCGEPVQTTDPACVLAIRF